jgi:flagellar protein FlbD
MADRNRGGVVLIKVIDVSGKEKYINCDLIEKIELIPDTLIVLLNGKNMIVRETPEELVERIAIFKRRCAGAGAALSRKGECPPERNKSDGL